MPKRTLIGTLFAVLACLVYPQPGWAEPVQIVSGRLFVDLYDPQGSTNSSLNLVGEDGFSLNASWFGVTPAWTSCSSGNCAVGTAVSTDFDFFVDINRATVNGTQYGPGAAQIAFSIEGGDVTLIPSGLQFSDPVPFVFSAVFSAPGNVVNLAGRGDARILLAGGAVAGASYDFADGTAPVPEPASMLLVGGGLALVARRVRRKRAGDGHRSER